MSAISARHLLARALAVLAGLTLIATAHGAEKRRVWGGGEKGWAGWTASGGWVQHSAARAGNPDPTRPHWESGEQTTGTLRSPVMTLEEDYLQFWVNGWDGEGLAKGKNHFTLRLAQDGSILRERHPTQGDNFIACNWIVSDLKGQSVYFEADDGLAGNGYAWIGLAQVVGVRVDTSAGGSPYRALTPAPWFKKSELSMAERGGIPFICANRPSLFEEKGPVRLEVGCRARHLFLLGMTTTSDQGCNGWSLDYSIIFFLGDEVGRIRVVYRDGVSEEYPLIMGENVWWGQRFFEFPEPFASESAAQKILERTLRLYPARPQADGRYLAVIEPRPVAIQYVELADAPAKLGVPVLSAVTVEVAESEQPAQSEPLSATPLKPEMRRFIKTMALRHDVKDAKIQKDLDALRGVMYATESNFPRHVALDVPARYQGPRVRFEGDRYAEVLTNMFHHNVQDIRDKVDQEGVYHTSTKDAPSWGEYHGFGTFKKKQGQYFFQYWSRDMGRSMQELAALGFLAEPRRNAEWAFKEARVWSSGRSDLKLGGRDTLPPHWCRTLNMPDLATEGPLTGCFENDGHGLTCLEVYQVWRHMPDGNAWAKAHWDDIQAAGDWILWQFAHPELSKATDVLWTQSECAGGKGHTIYADFLCMEALRGLAEIADAVGKPDKAKAWLERAELMQKGIERNYIVSDSKYGKTWTLKSAGWPNRSTPLGPIICLADRRGLDPGEDDPAWRAITAATYQELIDATKPFGYYGAAMGYGQGFFSQAALLLDRMRDATTMMQWAARETYNAHYKPYIVPEGSIIDKGGKNMFRMADIGNGVQEAEIVKSMRVLIGVDDLKPERLRLLPRMPYGWTAISIEQYPALVRRRGETRQALLSYKLRRDKQGGMSFDLTSDRPLPAGEVRLGPFVQAPAASGVRLNGRPVPATVERSGDSFWTRVQIPDGATQFNVKVKGK